ncbi:MAG TPA: sulfocyanin-like copper-binding protein [Candidatus Saccharimonadales bacterium]|nr:sulfocyanin-like copper-binding protein [Candidatus Saccharimonadales bacterium]
MRQLSVVLAAALILATACGGAPESSEQPTLSVDLTDFAVKADPGTVKAGHNVFAVRNRASMIHDLVVIRTDLAPNALPIDGGKAKEDGKVGGVANLSGGISRKLVLELPAGRYVLICNVPGHYQLGMRTALTVE